jgi:hypothetical protein
MDRLLRLDRLNRIDSMFLHTGSLAHLVLQSTQSGIHFLGIFYHYTRLACNGNNGFLVVSPHFVDRSINFIHRRVALLVHNNGTITFTSYLPLQQSSRLQFSSVHFSSVAAVQYSALKHSTQHDEVPSTSVCLNGDRVTRGSQCSGKIHLVAFSHSD